MGQSQAWFHMVAYLINRGRQASLIIFKVVSESGSLHSSIIISLKTLLFLVLLENCNLYD